MKGTRPVLIILLLMGLLLGPETARATEDKSIIKIGSDVTIEQGTQVRNVVAIGGQITVNGTVDKSIWAVGGSVVLTKTAVVGENVVALGGVIVAARDATVGGSLTEINSSNLYETMTAALSSEWEGWSWVFAIISLSIFVVLLVLALLIAALLPKPVLTISEAITENTFKVVLWGLLGLVMIAPLALLLTISVVGIALIPLEVIIVACSVLLGFIAVGQHIGRNILRLLRRPHLSLVRETFWGLIVLWLVGWLPYIGWMVKAVAIVVGLGAVLVTRFGTHQGWKCVPLPPAMAVPGGQPEPVEPQPSTTASVQPEPMVPAVPAAVEEATTTPHDPAIQTSPPTPPAETMSAQPAPVVADVADGPASTPPSGSAAPR